jgi:hypothetical protein
MPMSPKKRAALETKMTDHLNRVRISPTGIRNAGAAERVAVKVMRDGEDIYLAAIDEGPKNVAGLRINAVAALNMALNVLEALKEIFPGTLQIEAIQHPVPPKGQQH